LILKKANVSSAGGRFELKQQPIPEPGRGWVRVKVQVCGVCHSDALAKDGIFPGIVYPRSLGHGIAGMVDALGPGTDPWKIGDRVGVGWHGGHCGRCDSCRRRFHNLRQNWIPGISYDGRYSEYVCESAEALAHIPEYSRSGSSTTPTSCRAAICRKTPADQVRFARPALARHRDTLGFERAWHAHAA
jgi:alcohol dehydrogenase/propanol-preferring alcohol dehydrogenase